MKSLGVLRFKEGCFLMAWSLHRRQNGILYALMICQIWQSRRQVVVQIQFMNIHVEWKYHCSDLIAKFSDVWVCQNWRLNPPWVAFRDSLLGHCKWMEATLIPGGGGYSLCDGWYICAAVLTPFFHFGRIEHDLFGVFFLIHQHQNDLLWYQNYQFLQNSIF